MSESTATADVTRMQELIYKLNASTAMAKNIVTVEANTTMREVQTLFKEKRITGMPVVRDGNLIGIISLEDFIKWLADGSNESYVSERMTREVVTVYSDDPLVKVVSTLEKYGFGRVPVLERSTDRIVGIVTKADIIQALLHALDTDFHTEEIRHFKSGHLFDDIVSDEMKLTFKYTIAGGSIEAGGTVASAVKKTLKRLGVHPTVVRRISIATYEAEMNVIIYADSGCVVMTVDPHIVEIDVGDSGPGIPDIDVAMRPGYSTAPEWVRELGFGAGMGLANISACSDSLDIRSEPDHGTRLLARFSMEERCT